MKKFLRGLLVARVHFNEIGKNADRRQCITLPLLDCRKDTLYSLGCVAAVRNDFFERILRAFTRENSERSSL